MRRQYEDRMASLTIKARKEDLEVFVRWAEHGSIPCFLRHETGRVC
jgi:hypothetical protein